MLLSPIWRGYCTSDLKSSGAAVASRLQQKPSNIQNISSLICWQVWRQPVSHHLYDKKILQCKTAQGLDAASCSLEMLNLIWSLVFKTLLPVYFLPHWKLEWIYDSGSNLATRLCESSQTRAFTRVSRRTEGVLLFALQQRSFRRVLLQSRLVFCCLPPLIKSLFNRGRKTKQPEEPYAHIHSKKVLELILEVSWLSYALTRGNISCCYSVN